MLAGSLKSAFLANMQTSVCLSTHGLTYPWGDTYVSLSENQFLNVHGIPEPPPPTSGTLYFLCATRKFTASLFAVPLSSAK